ncbi:hypothetical protein BJ166DRAFT_596110 [Pestalotiopsis sp. NC0098]|nr:hypothetical protein BJ166DRAFT_596110 [Pestalotiopsis sp. NC0098]
MRAVDNKIQTSTRIRGYLSDAQFNEFRGMVREKIRQEYDAQFDSWPQGVVHNYIADAKRIILATVNETWDTLFAVPEASKKYLSDDQFDEFRGIIREKIRQEYNAQMDNWPQGVAHPYTEDAKRIIFTTVSDMWDAYFSVPDGVGDTVLSEILFPAFFE